jgi:ribosomal protein S3AE
MLQVPKPLTILVIKKWWYINSTQQTQARLLNRVYMTQNKQVLQRILIRCLSDVRGPCV